MVERILVCDGLYDYLLSAFRGFGVDGQFGKDIRFPNEKFVDVVHVLYGDSINRRDEVSFLDTESGFPEGRPQAFAVGSSFEDTVNLVVSALVAADLSTE